MTVGQSSRAPSFVELSIAASSCYPEMLEHVKNSDKLLDLGCAFGQELPHLMSYGFFLISWTRDDLNSFLFS